MATKKFLSLERLQEYDALIKQEIADAASSATSGKADASHTHDDRYYTETEIDTKLSAVNTSITNITSGTTVVKEAEHATSADSATTANSANEATHAASADSATIATKATQDGNGNVIADTYVTNEALGEQFASAEEGLGVVLSTKADADHNHDNDYDAKGAATTALDSAKSYTDTAVSGLASTSTVDSKISTHNTSTTAHADIRELISDLSTQVNNFLDVDDTTKDELSEVLALIDANKGTLDSLTSNKINKTDIADNLTTSDATKVLSAKQGVTLKGLIDALQTAVDSKTQVQIVKWGADD